MAAALTAKQAEDLQVWAQKTVHGYRPFNDDEFKNAIANAAESYVGEYLVMGKDGQMSLPKLVHSVITNTSRNGFGVPHVFWWIFFEAQIFKKIENDPWNEVKWWLWHSMHGKGQTLTMHGCQNSGKTDWLGRFSVLQLVAWTSHAHFYIAGPYKIHSEDKVWQAIIERIDEINKAKTSFFLALGVKVEKAKAVISFTDAHGEKGEARFVSIDDASSIQGKKARDHANPLKGIVCVVVDEFVENPGLKLIQAESNVSSNGNYFGILACNPLPEKVQHPSLRGFSAATDISRLDRDIHYRWDTAYGVCVRFAWANCPNRIIGRPEWPYLLTVERMERARKKGNDTIDAQVDAWGWGVGGRALPLDESAINIAGTYVEPVWQSTPVRTMAVDCAFGGQDAATATIIEVGDSLTSTRDGSTTAKTVAAGVAQLILPVRSEMKVTKEWLSEMDRLLKYSGGNFPQTVQAGASDIKVGDTLSGAWDMAYHTLKTMVEYEVLPGNVTFDSSQRGDCTSIMIDCLGRNNVRWFYDGSRKIVDEENLSKGWWKWPYSYQRNSEGSQEPEKWSNSVSQTSSMIWLFACNAIRAGLLCNGGSVKRGLDELCARPMVSARKGQGEGKRDVLGKERMKAAGMKSPTYGEGIAMSLYFSIRFLGLIPLAGPSLSITISPVQPVRAELIINGRRGLRVRPKWFK